jgi:YesN/AraC family two-component response regulator
MDIELQLQQDSHFVVSASDADKAIVVLRTQAVDLVLTDIDMPDRWMDSDWQLPYGIDGRL